VRAGADSDRRPRIDRARWPGFRQLLWPPRGGRFLCGLAAIALSAIAIGVRQRGQPRLDLTGPPRFAGVQLRGKRNRGRKLPVADKPIEMLAAV